MSNVLSLSSGLRSSGTPKIAIFPLTSCVALTTLYTQYRATPSLVNFYMRDVASAVHAAATWLAGWVAGWVSVTRRYCIKTAKPILKIFRPSESPIILVSSDSCTDTHFQGEPLQGVLNTPGWEKLTIFDGNRRLSRKRCETGRWLLWNVNGKSCVPDSMVSFSMTLSDPKPGYTVPEG